jgi:hypothetical protein
MGGNEEHAMSGIQLLSGAALAMLATAGTDIAVGARASEADARLKDDLVQVSGRRIYFGHQSVGWNLIDGLRKLAEREGVALRIVEVKGSLEVAPGTFAHGPVEANGAPLRKLESFTAIMGGGPRSPVEIALMKFCYVDFGAETDSRKLFERYRATIEDLRLRNPGTAFVHVTAPLTTIQEGPKAFAKRLLGMAPGGVRENARREEFNALLREEYRGRDSIFDLAALESTREDGSRVTVEWQGKPVPLLDGSYTDDGGHLNELGRIRAARELARILAQVPLTDPGAGAGR